MTGKSSNELKYYDHHFKKLFSTEDVTANQENNETRLERSKRKSNKKSNRKDNKENAGDYQIVDNKRNASKRQMNNRSCRNELVSQNMVGKMQEEVTTEHLLQQQKLTDNMTIGKAKEQLLMNRSYHVRNGLNPSNQNYLYTNENSLSFGLNNINQQLAGFDNNKNKLMNGLRDNSGLNNRLLDNRIKVDLFNNEQQDLEFVNDETPKIVGDYKYYRLFTGDLNCYENNKNQKLEKIQMLTCSRAQLVARFTEIKNNINLNLKLDKKTFESYIQKVLAGTSQDGESLYSLLPGWLQGHNHQIQA